MRTSRYLLAAAVALFAGSCDMVEGAVPNANGQQTHTSVNLPAVAPVSGEFLSGLEDYIENYNASLNVYWRARGRNGKAQARQEMENILKGVLGLRISDTKDIGTLYTTAQQIVNVQQLDSKPPKVRKIILNDLFNVCVLFSLGIDPNIFTQQLRAKAGRCFTEGEAVIDGRGGASWIMQILPCAPRLKKVMIDDLDSPGEFANILNQLRRGCGNTLTELNIAFCNGTILGNSWIIPLINMLCGNQTLESLCLNGFNTSTSFYFFVRKVVENCEYLRLLDLQGCEIGLLGVAGLSEELERPSCRIERLDISDNPVEDTAFSRLARGIVVNGFNCGDLYSVKVGKRGASLSLSAQKDLTIALYLNPRMCELEVVDNSLTANFPDLQDNESLINQAWLRGLIISDEEEKRVRADLEMPEAAAIPVLAPEMVQRLHKNMDDLARIRKLFELRNMGTSVNLLNPLLQDIINDLPKDFRDNFNLLDLSQGPEAKFALALKKRLWKDMKVTQISSIYEWASQIASGFKDTKEKNIFNICVLSSLGIKSEDLSKAYSYTRQKVVNWFTADDKVCDFSYYKRYCAKRISDNEIPLLLHGLWCSPKLRKVIFSGGLSDRNNILIMRQLRRYRGDTPIIEIQPSSQMFYLPTLLNGNQALRVLRFRNFTINDFSVLSIMEQVKTCKNLNELCFDNCGISDIGATRISEELMRPGCRIKHLYISSNCMSGIGFVQLARAIVINGFNKGRLQIVRMHRENLELPDDQAKTIEIAKCLNPNIKVVDVWFKDVLVPKDDDALINEAARLGLIRGSEEEAKARSILENRRKAEAAKSVASTAASASATAAAPADSAVAEEDVQAPAEKKSRVNEGDHGTTNGQ